MTSFNTDQDQSNFVDLIEEGHEKLVWLTPKAPMSFRFVWEKVLFVGRLSKSGNQHRLILLGDMGPLPYSAENPGFRDRLLRLVSWAPEDRIKFVLEPHRQQIFIMIDDVLEDDLTGNDLVASAVASLFHAKPFIQLAKEIGWQHPADEAPPVPNIISRKMTKSD